MFAYVVGSLASRFWSQFPQQWKNAILSDHAANSIWKEESAALQNIYSGLFDGDVAECPPELLDLLWRYLDHSDAAFRKAAGVYALVHWARLPSRFHDALCDRFRVETDLRVLMEILQAGMSGKEPAADLSLAEIVLERVNKVGSAWLMEIIRDKNREPDVETSAFVGRCRAQAGAFAGAFELPDLQPAEVAAEPPVVRVAWLWKQVTGGNPSLSGIVSISVPIPGEMPPPSLVRPRRRAPDPFLETAPFLLDIARGLHGRYSVCAHYILSHQHRRLPPLLREYLSVVENGQIILAEDQSRHSEDVSDEVREAIASGRREYDSRPNAIPAFPIDTLGAGWC